MNLSTTRAIFFGAALLGATFMLVSPCQAQVAENSVQDGPIDEGYAGEWKGTLQLRAPQLLNTPPDRADIDEMRIQIVIKGITVRIFLDVDGKTIEALPGRLNFFPAGRIAVINGWTVDSKDGKYPSWIESISISLDLQSPGVMLAEWRRVVNNVGAESTAEPAWSIAFGGTLRRTTSHAEGTNQ